MDLVEHGPWLILFDHMIRSVRCFQPVDARTVHPADAFKSRPLPHRTHLASYRLPHENHLTARGVRARVRTGERAGLLSCMPLATDFGAAGLLAARLARPLGVGASAGASAISSAASSSSTLSAASTCLLFAPDFGVARRAGLLAKRLACPGVGATSSTLTNRLKLTGDGRRDDGRALLMERPLCAAAMASSDSPLPFSSAPAPAAKGNFETVPWESCVLVLQRSASNTIDSPVATAKTVSTEASMRMSIAGSLIQCFSDIWRPTSSGSS